MGWNDHVAMIEMECLDCGVVSVWESWNDIAKARYGGDLGLKMGHDIKHSDRCPECGSTNGKPTDEEEDDYDDD